MTIDRFQPRPAVTGRRLALLAIAPLALVLAGCVSLGGGKPPDSLLTLTTLTAVPAGSGAAAGRDSAGTAIAVYLPDTPAKLDVLRLPVAVSDTEIAYLKEAFWVEKPARLFRRLVGETIRTSTSALVLDSDDTPLLADVGLRGTLLDMGYDSRTSSVVVRFDAVRTDTTGRVTSRRFEAVEGGIAARPEAIGPALNRAANEVAREIAEWVAE
ncbi:MAG: ABC-type transport auxiliary lipoprotein family protein [Erythrobacter sp.]